MNINQKSPAWLTNILSVIISILGLLLTMKDEVLALASLIGFDVHLALLTKIFSIIAAVLAIVKLLFSKVADTIVKSLNNNEN